MKFATMSLRADLTRLHLAGLLKAPWLPGMFVLHPATGGIFRCTAVRGPGFCWEPDLTDPATRGCLLALLREATGHCVIMDRHREYVRDDTVATEWWTALDLDVEDDIGTGPTEGEAIAAAIHALAEGK